MSNYITASTAIDSTNNMLLFNSEGYYVVGDEQWQDITFITEVIYNGGNIGIAPRIYDTNMFMTLSIYNEDADEQGLEKIGLASLNAQITYSTLSIAQAKIAPLVQGRSYVIKAEIKGTNYRIYLDDKVIFNIEYPGMSKGKVGIYATAGNACKSIEVQSAFAEGWTTNIASRKGAIAGIRELPNEDKYLYLSHPDSTVYAQQTFTVASGKLHTLSFNMKGAGTAHIIEANGASPKTYNYVLLNSADWGQHSFTEMISSDCTRVTIRFQVNRQNIMVNDIQFEEKSFATGYIHNDSITAAKNRDNSVITYPAKDNIKGDTGSLAMWVKPSMTYNMDASFKPVLFQYGESRPLSIAYESGSLRFHYGDTFVEKDLSMNKDEWYNIVATWSRNRLQLYVNGVLVEKTGEFQVPDESKLILIGHSSNVSKNVFFGAIDETIVLSTVLSEKEVVAIAESVEPILNNTAMIMRATFNYAIGNFNKSIIEATLAPNYGSPVLVEKPDGTAMRKVSFFDFYTGEYRTFNEELVEYDKAHGYVEVSYHDKDIDQESFQLSVEDAEGITYGGPYELRGRRVYLSLSKEEKEYLDGKHLYVTYQLENSYTVDFNIGVPDSFRVTLGKHDGQPVKVTYEGNRFTDEKLLTMVELNPMLNPNHEGFLYITRNDEKVTSFRVRATPESLPANGGSEALVVVEPLDANGNYVSHCRLDVTADMGTIVPAYDEESIKLRDRAGRFLYRYRSPILELNRTRRIEVEDAINVIDRETGIGVQLPITLTVLIERDHKRVAGDTIEKIAERYGSTIEDIAYTSDMMAKVKQKYGTAAVDGADTVDKVIANARRYIASAAVNTFIKVPINYSARQLQKNAEAVAHDKMIAYLTEIITDYMNRPAKDAPSGLGSLLDFNGDGMINVREAIWLKENRLTTVLQDKYEAVLAWDNAN